jgi:peptide/nickel transport system substrate-binding protein
MNQFFRKFVVSCMTCFTFLSMSEAVKAQPKDTLIIGLASLGGERLDYTRPSGGTNRELRRVLARELIEIGPNGEFVPGVAESWKANASSTVWDLFLRKGVQWHNGDSLTAQDVIFGVERMKRPEISAGYFTSGLYENLDRVEAINDHHVRYHFKKSFPAFPFFVNVALPVPKKYLQTVGDEVFTNSKPVGMGPFKLVKMVKGGEYEFEAFDGYYGTKPAFKRLILKIMPENSTRIAALKTGEIDIAKDVQGRALIDVRSTPGLSITSAPSGTSSHLNFAHMYEKDSPWADVRVRKAVAMAIDRQTIAMTIFAGEASPAIFPECGKCGTFGMPKDLKPWPYDPVAAKALLAEAGYPNGLPGEWDLQTMQSGSAPSQPEVTQAVGSYLAKIGIKTKFQLMEGGAFGAAYRSKKLKGLPVKGSGETNLDVGLKKDVWAARAEAWSMLNDEDTNKLWDEQMKTADVEKRRKLLEEAVKIMINEARVIPLVEVNTIFGLGKRIKEYKLRQGTLYVTDALENVVFK